MKKFFDKIDVGKKFPNYINKNIFRTALVLTLLLGILVFITNNYSIMSAYAECPADNVFSCQNPYCHPDTRVDDCIKLPKSYCNKYPRLCNNMEVPPGKTYGSKPNFLLRNFNTLSFGLLAFAFLINHLVWRKNND